MKRFLTGFLLLLVLFAIPIFGNASKAMGPTGSIAGSAAPLTPQRRIIYLRPRYRRYRRYHIVRLRPRHIRYRYRRYRY
jgi:hypothetical protein